VKETGHITPDYARYIAASPFAMLARDGGWLEILELEDSTLKIRYEGACGSCPSSLTGTLMAIENMIQDEIDPEIKVIVA